MMVSNVQYAINSNTVRKQIIASTSATVRAEFSCDIVVEYQDDDANRIHNEANPSFNPWVATKAETWLWEAQPDSFVFNMPKSSAYAANSHVLLANHNALLTLPHKILINGEEVQ